MGPLNWLLWLGLTAAAATLTAAHYRLRETPGRGRMLLAGLRALALALALLLLFDPELPARGLAPGAGTQVLLDASLSMQLPAGNGGTRWDAALQVVRGRHGGRAILLFGDRARAVASADLPASAPGDARTLLLPALQAAAEAGVHRVIVVSDGAIEDADAVARWAPRLGIEIVTESVGAPLDNRSITEVAAPAWVEAGAAFTVEFAIAAPPGDSLRVLARSGGRAIGRTVVAAPAPGRLATGSMELRLAAPPGGATLPLEIALEEPDLVADDDQRTVYVHVSEQPAGVALVSFQPDWEPRFLAPVLAQSLGVPVRAFLAGVAGRYVRLGAGLEAGQPVEEDVVRRAVAAAELVVLHAIGGDAPAWAIEALERAPRLLVFPAGEAAALPLPVRPGAARAGDFFAASVPASPVAALFAGQELAGTAPLASLRAAEAPAGAWSPLLLARGRQGALQPAVLAGEAGGRRWAVALGTGYWQWAFRGGEERQLYTRLWGSLGGWLVRERPTVGLPPVRPGRLATPRGLPIPWIAAGLAADSIGVTITAGDGGVVMDTVVATAAADTAWTAALPPGDYGYRATAWVDDTVTEAAGPLTVERYSPELARTPADMEPLRTAATPVRGAGVARRGGVPLHTTPYPYVLLVLLLATEWILRRRWGLR